MSSLKSAATRLRRQIATGSFLPLTRVSSSTRPRRQAGSQGRSQVRPRMPGKHVGLPVDHVGVGVAAVRRSAGCIRGPGCGRGRPTGNRRPCGNSRVRDIGRLQAFSPCASAVSRGPSQSAPQARIAPGPGHCLPLHFLQSFAYGLEHHARMESGRFLLTEQQSTWSRSCRQSSAPSWAPSGTTIVPTSHAQFAFLTALQPTAGWLKNHKKNRQRKKEGAREEKKNNARW